MTEDLIKKLTGKNKPDFEFAAQHLVDSADVEMFKALVEKDDFLFDFVKENVAQRIANAVNEGNYENLLKFLEFYSPSYDEVIISSLAKFADEDLTDEMLELFENGNNAQKTYCAKYFAYIQDPLAIELLKKNSYTEDDFLNSNCASTLGVMNEESSYKEALGKLKTGDEFEQLKAVKFLGAYGNSEAIPYLIEVMKTSTMSENIAGEIPYLADIFSILEQDKEGGLLIINNIVNGLGEIIPLSSVFDYELYEVFERLMHNAEDSCTAIVLLNANEKFDTLTENDEYLFDEDKNTKKEILDIKKLLGNIHKKELLGFVNAELREDSPFVYTALDFAQDMFAVRELLKCSNQTVIVKTAEVLKAHNELDDTSRQVALLKITDDNIKSIIRAL
ncbi:hypothetical protein IKU74_02350 [bacterium]|nr:hypothetical protein [bacterium]